MWSVDVLDSNCLIIVLVFTARLQVAFPAWLLVKSNQIAHILYSLALSYLIFTHIEVWILAQHIEAINSDCQIFFKIIPYSLSVCLTWAFQLSYIINDFYNRLRTHHLWFAACLFEFVYFFLEIKDNYILATECSSHCLSTNAGLSCLFPCLFFFSLVLKLVISQQPYMNRYLVSGFNRWI